MSDLPKSLETQEREEDVGASHGQVTGSWRIVRNGVLLCVLALVVVLAFAV